MNSRKRKITKNTKQQQIVDEDISSIEEDEENKSKLPKIIEKSTDNESVSEKRLRMAEQILKKIQDAESSSDEEGVEDIVSHRLSKEQRKNAGIYFKKMASNYTDKKLKVEKSFTGHKMSPTCVTITKDETFIYSCGKDSKIIQYDIEAGMKFVINGKKKSENSPTHHYGTVYAVAVSPNGKFLATGGVDSTIKIYDCRTHDLIETFKGHRDTISCLQFHPMNSTLFSGSFDRTMKVWNLDDMLYMDTLFGHQSPINSLNMIHLGGTEYNPITSSDDITCRYWKINEETQLVYRNQHTSSIDSVSPGPQKNTFLSASQDGSVSLWSVNKKFPLHVQKDAHDGNWVISCAMYNQSDLLFSGSSNGKLNLYQYDDDSFKSINSVKVTGFINHIAVAPRSKLVVAAVGCEHKFGRWYFDKNITNRIDIIKL